MATVTTQHPGQGAAGTEVLPFDQAMRRYEGEWVLLRPVTLGEDRWPAEVQVIAHSRHEQAVWDGLLHLLREQGEPPVPYHVLQAARYIRTGEGLRHLLSQFAMSDQVPERGGPGARRWP